MAEKEPDVEGGEVIETGTKKGETRLREKIVDYVKKHGSLVALLSASLGMSYVIDIQRGIVHERVVKCLDASKNTEIVEENGTKDKLEFELLRECMSKKDAPASRQEIVAELKKRWLR